MRCAERPRASRRHVPTLLGLAAGVAVAGSFAGPAGAVVPEGSRTPNPSFESGTDGWGGFQSRVTQAPRPDAPDGRSVARVAVAGSATNYSIDDSTPAVPSTSGGRRYVATAAVRAGSASAAGRRVRIVLRITTAGGTSTTCAEGWGRLGRSFITIRATCVAPRSGDQLDVYVARNESATPGEAFFVDGISVTGRRQAALPPGDPLPDPSFESGAAGWLRTPAAVTGAVAPEDGDVPVGERIARVGAVGGAGTGYGLDGRATVPAAGAHRYVASAWVRGTATSDGRDVMIEARERTPAGVVVQRQSATVRLSAERFRRLAVPFTALATGNTLDVAVSRRAAAFGPSSVVAGDAFLLDAVGLQGRSPATIPLRNRTANPGMEDGTTNWTAYRGTVSAVPADDAPEGRSVARVVAGDPREHDAFTLDDARPAVSSTAPGHTYRASAWVRGGVAPGGSGRRLVRLVVRQRDGRGHDTSTRSAPVALDPDSYRQLTVDVLTRAAGSSLDVEVERFGGVVRGESFFADAVTLADAPVATVFGSAVTVRPDRPLPAGGTDTASVETPRNASAAFQVALRTAGVPLSGIRAALAGDLRGPGGATLPAASVSLAREDAYDVRRVTDGEGDTGAWPDRLTPDREPLTGGDGGAFPIDLGPRSAATVWADVAVPPDARPGVYTGTLRLTAAGSATPIDVPVRVRVRSFALPSTSSLRSLFPVNPTDVCADGRRDGKRSASRTVGGFTGLQNQNGGCDVSREDTWKLFSRFAQLGLRNRVTISNPYPTSNQEAPSDAPVTGTAGGSGDLTQTTAFERYVRPLLDGRSAQGTLPGARLTSFNTWWGCIRDRPDCVSDWKTFIDRNAPEARSRFVPWVCDEPFFDDSFHATPWLFDGAGTATDPAIPRLKPPTGDVPGEGPTPPSSCALLRERVRKQWPGVPVKITTSIDDPGLYGVKVSDRARPPVVGPEPPPDDAADILAPEVGTIVTRDTNPDAGAPYGDGHRRTYEAFARRRGAENWAYVACPSGGCDPTLAPDDPFVRDPRHDGWPSYGIDQPGSQASAMGWMAFLYDLEGESYFDTAAGFNEGPGFQYGIDTYGENGDGQLFYPGRVRLKGGRSEDVPFESVRLRRIGQGRQDYELLHLLDRCGRRDEAMRVTEGLFGDRDHAMFQTTVSQEQLDRARGTLSDLIERDGCG